MSLDRRSLLKGTGAAGAAVAAGAVVPKVFRSSQASAQDTVKLSVWKAPHTPDDQKFFDEKLAAYAEANPGIEIDADCFDESMSVRVLQSPGKGMCMRCRCGQKISQ